MSREQLLMQILNRFNKGEFQSKSTKPARNDLYSKKSFPKDDDAMKRTNFLEKRGQESKGKPAAPEGDIPKTKYLGGYKPYLERRGNYLENRSKYLDGSKGTYLPHGGYEYKTKMFKSTKSSTYRFLSGEEEDKNDGRVLESFEMSGPVSDDPEHQSGSASGQSHRVEVSDDDQSQSLAAQASPQKAAGAAAPNVLVRTAGNLQVQGGSKSPKSPRNAAAPSGN